MKAQKAVFEHQSRRAAHELATGGLKQPLAVQPTADGISNAFQLKEMGLSQRPIARSFRKDGFELTVRKTEKRKACPTRVTFKQMEQLLSCMTDPDERLAELHAIMDVAKAQKNCYEYVRQWFLLNYPNFREYQAMDANYRIVAPKLHLLPEAKDKKSA